MKTPVLALATLLLATVLSGCSSGGGDASSSTTTQAATTSATSTTGAADTTTGASTSATTTTAAANAAPTGTFAASVQKGSLPLNVTFTLKGSDSDGDALEWTLDFGDGTPPAKSNATSTFPATVKHAYAKVGNFSAVYNLTDGKESAAQRLPINVTAKVAAAKPVTEKSCTTTTGFGAGGVNGQVLGTGGCSMGRSEVAVTVVKLDFPTGCRSFFNEGTDNTTDGEAQVGTTYPSGTDFGMYCDFGTLNPVGKISFTDA